MVLHADPVPQDGPARERTRRVDGDDPDCPALGPKGSNQLIDETTLAHAGWSRHADDPSPTGSVVHPLQDFTPDLRGIVQPPNDTGQGPHVTEFDDF